MKNYVCMTINKADTDNEQAISKFTDFITQKGGEVSKVKNCGVMKMAYPRNGEETALYILFHFKATPLTVMELDKNLDKDKTIICKMIISDVNK